MKKYIVYFSFAIFLFSTFGNCTKQKPIQSPNFIFILADDLGFSQIGCYGSNYYQTPNIDKLASEGMRFTNAYAACPVCSPTRASVNYPEPRARGFWKKAKLF